MPARRLLLPAAILGWALSGFFDGILLHQVLQWHHLLSLVPDQTLRTQIMADGLFHVAMYGFALWGLALMFRRRASLGQGGARRVLLGGLLLGFGVWNVVDVVGFHWLAGIHRIRVGVPDPLLYDLGWLAAFALPPIAAAVWLLRRQGVGGAAGQGVVAALAAVVLAGGWQAAQPVLGVDTALVLFAPGIPDSARWNAVAAAGGRVLWVDGALWAASLPRPGSAARLAARGAFVTRSPALAGCLAATRAG